MTVNKIVACPKCATQLQLPQGFGGGKIKCPKCSQILAIPAPAAPATPAAPVSPAPISRAPAPQLTQPPAPTVPDDPFGDLPNLPAATQPQASAFPPATGGAVYRPPPARKSAPTKKAKKSKKQGTKRESGGAKLGGVLRTLGITVGAIIFLAIGGLVVLGMFARRHSGWKKATFHGYTINMPGNGKQTQRVIPQQGVSVNELGGQRRESGSQYFIDVAKMPNLPDGSPFTLELMRNNPMSKVSGMREITRDGVKGFAGKTNLMSGLGNAEVEMFVHKGDLIVLGYAPYHMIKDKVGGKMQPRSNERELDKPEEFFASIKFK